MLTERIIIATVGQTTVGTTVSAVNRGLPLQKHHVELMTHRLKQATSVLVVHLSYHFQCCGNNFTLEKGLTTPKPEEDV